MPPHTHTVMQAHTHTYLYHERHILTAIHPKEIILRPSVHRKRGITAKMVLPILTKDNLVYASPIAIPKLPLNLSQWHHYFSIDNEGDTPLMMSIILGDEKGAAFIIELAKEHSCINLLNVQNRTYRQTALHLAVICNMTSIAKAMISVGVDLTIKDRNGNTALHIACQRCATYYDLQCGCICTAILHHITNTYGDSVCRELANLYNYNGKNCLHMAVASNNIYAIGYLLTQVCSNINSKEKKNGRTVLHQVICEKNIFLLAYLLHYAKGCDIEAKTWDGHTALRLAYSSKSYLIIKLLSLHFMKEYKY